MDEINVNTGDKVEIVSKDKNIKGVVMPGEKDIVVVKLENGYNIGINKSNIRSIKILERFKEEKEKKAKKENKKEERNKEENKKETENKSSKKKELPTIALLQTGGTIASKVDYKTGGVVSRYSPEEILEMYPELKEIANIECRLIGTMWTDDFRFKNFTTIANEIIKEKNKKVDGIILTLGTDFMTYCATALAFMLQGIDIPVILTGAQRSSDRGSSDASMNLVCASEFIAKSNFKGVAICMHETQNDISCAILPPCKSRKMHSSRRDAFRSINSEAIARVNYETRNITWIDDKFVQESGKFNPMVEMEEKVGLIKVHPNMSELQFACFRGYKGLVIEGSGLGHAPTGVPNKEAEPNLKINAEIKKLIDSGTIVVMTTQCLYGAINMNIYSRGRELLEMGILQARCLPETALIKLSWLLGNFEKEMKNKKKAQELIDKEFSNEMFFRVEDNTFLI